MTKPKKDPSIVIENMQLDDEIKHKVVTSNKVIKPKKKITQKPKVPKEIIVSQQLDKNQYNNDTNFNDPLNAWTNPNQMETKQEPSPIEIMIKEMIGIENIKMKTDLTDNLIVGLTKGDIYATLFNNPIMKQLVDNVSFYRVSRNGKGRSQIVEMAKSLGSYGAEENPSFLNRLFKGE
jgi:hypothetical protein